MRPLVIVETTVLSMAVLTLDMHSSHLFLHSLLGVFLVNVLVHMHLLIGGVGVHWYCIRSKRGAGIDCSRVLPAMYT